MIGVPFYISRASDQPTAYRFGSGKTQMGYIWVWKKEDEKQEPKSCMRRICGRRQNLELLWPPCLQSKNKTVTNCVPQDKKKNIKSACEDCFLTWTIPWMIHWQCLGRCHELNSVDRCKNILKPVFCPFWFMFINIVIKARS